MIRALVISGGGSKGAFAVGVLNTLHRQFINLNFDVFVGTSTGSLIIPLLAAKKYDLLTELYTTQTTANIIIKYNLGDRLNEHSIFNSAPLWTLIEKYFTDALYKQLMNEKHKMYFTTVCLQTGKLCVFTTDENPQPVKDYELIPIQNAVHFRKAILASASQPVFMPPVMVNKNMPGFSNPNYQFVDGGVREYAGLEMAIDQGAGEIFTISLSVNEKASGITEYKNLFSILERTIDIFMDDVGKNDLLIPGQYNEALKYVEAVKSKMKRNGVSSTQIQEYFAIQGRQSPYEDKVPLKFFNFRPAVPLGGGPGGLNFDPAEMKSMMAAGEQNSNDFIAALPPADITWA